MMPGIFLDAAGVCNYCYVHDQLDREYPLGSEGMKRLRQITGGISRAGRPKKYDVIVGVSGGCDSSYLLYITKRLGLRPLAVHFDNGWNTPIAIANIRKMVSVLDIDLYTYAVDHGEYDDICRSFLMSGIRDVDIPNDIAMTTALYKVAEAENVKYIFIGHSFRTEGIAPLGWSYMDGKYIESVQKRYGNHSLKTFPNLWLSDFVRWAAVGGIKRIRPLYYVDYQKERVKNFLSEQYGWQWYGGHHLENRFTAFVNTYYLPRRYNIDMRLLGYSALIRSEQMTREEGLELLRRPVEIDSELIELVRRRLGFSDWEFEHVMRRPKKTYTDFATYKQIFRRTRWFWWLMCKLNRVPKSFYLKYACGESWGK